MVGLKKNIFIKAAVITIIVFSAGLLFGYYLDTIRFDFVSEEILNISIASEDFIVSQMYLQNHPDYCKLMESRLIQIAEETDQLGADIESFGEKALFLDYKTTLRRYYIYEVRAWMVMEDYKLRCSKNITTILFFFKKNQQESMNEGIVLTAIRENNKGSVMVFSFDIDFNEPLLMLIKNDFNITKSPTVIFDKKKYEGFFSKEELEKIVLTK